MGITHEHPLAPENQIPLESLQKEGQVSGYHGEQLQEAQFWTIGFVVYRCDDYTDNALWERYMQMLRDEGERYFVKHKMDRTVASYWDWTVVEDRESLQGAGKEDVKQRHKEWRDARSEKRDGSGALHMITRWMPRFMCALHVGKDSLETLIACDIAVRQNVLPTALKITVAVVHVPFPHTPLSDTKEDEDEEDDDDYDDDYDEEEDENDPDRHDLGWMAVRFNRVMSAYNDMAVRGLWRRRYVRPPQVY